MRTCRLPFIVVLCCLISQSAHAQSDPSDFDAVISFPLIVLGQTFPGPDPGVVLNTPNDGVTTQINFNSGAVSTNNSTLPEAGNEINVFSGATINNFNLAAGGALNLVGGILQNGFSADGSTVNITGGTAGNSSFSVGPFAQVNMSDGMIGTEGSLRNSTLNISGGSIGDSFAVLESSTVNISGGRIRNSFDALGGSTVNLSGGVVGPAFSNSADSNLQIMGGQFRRNGVPATGSTFSLIDADDTLSGTLADGSSFIFSRLDFLHNVTLTPVSVPAIDLTPIVVDNPSATFPAGLREGQTLTVSGSGQLNDDFAVVNGTLNVLGGAVGEWAEVIGSVVNISGGNVGDHFQAHRGSVINISGGTIGEEFDAFFGSRVNISGGVLGDDFEANDGSVVNITGGVFDRDLEAEGGSLVNLRGGNVNDELFAQDGSLVNISGGTVAQLDAAAGSTVNIRGGTVLDFNGFAGSQVNLFGTEFMIDGVPLDALEVGLPMTIGDRDMTLSGEFGDGTSFSIALNSTNVGTGDFVSPTATLTVTLVDPTSGDFDFDADVDGFDFLEWQRNPSVGNLADWQTNYGMTPPALATSTAVPEPTSLLLTSCMVLFCGCRRAASLVCGR